MSNNIHLRKIGENHYRYDASGNLSFDVWLFDGTEYARYRGYVRRRYWCWSAIGMSNQGYATRIEAARAALRATTQRGL